MFCNLEMTINVKRCAKNSGPQGRKHQEAFAEVCEEEPGFTLQHRFGFLKARQ